MKDNASFRRKIIYLVVMALLIVPLSWISRPSFIDSNGQLSSGGLLMRMRTDYDLAQANLGDIDPASESMKLATLGMRGIAANILWEKANEFKKKEDWDNLTATLNQITKLQPNFISVWQFQSWNLSYNVSVEFDNYRHRYHWVKKGIDFLMEGTKYNRDEPRLLWDLGWFFGHKFGRSDEYRQFRRIYRTDDDFHRTLPLDLDQTWGPDDKPDNWLTAHQWFAQAQNVVDLEGKPIKGKNPLVFHSDPPKALIRFADAIEEEGYLGDRARLAWIDAAEAWDDYGGREIPSSFGYKIRLNDYEEWTQRSEEFTAELERLLPGVRERIKQERLATLTEKERELLDIPRHDWGDDYDIGLQAADKLEVSHEDVVAQAPAELSKQARRLVTRLKEAENFARTVRRYRDIVNFVYWRTRCAVEQKDVAIEGRKYLYDADQAYDQAELEGARELYEASWDRWAEIHDEYPDLADDVTAEDLVDAVNRYRSLLDQLDESFPPPGFKMMKLLEAHADSFDMSKDQVAALVKQHEEAQQALMGDDDSTDEEQEDGDQPQNTEESPESTDEDYSPSSSEQPVTDEDDIESGASDSSRLEAEPAPDQGDADAG